MGDRAEGEQMRPMTTSGSDGAALRCILEVSCPACAHQVAVPFMDGGCQPLATLAWPDSREEALDLPRLPLNFVSCVSCGHIFNTSFDYELVPYSKKPNLMYNKGKAWRRFIEKIQHRLASLLPDSPRVVEIGHGDGNFLVGLAALRPNGCYTGFDPNGSTDTFTNIHFEKSLFIPQEHMHLYLPNMIISRHVLEHLTNPLKFLQCISFVASHLENMAILYMEVPCVDNAIVSRRTVDFYYEHNSHFTTSSFQQMASLCPGNIIEIGHGYNREVVYGLIKLGDVNQANRAQDSLNLYRRYNDCRERIARQLDELHASGAVVVIWGGTGKSAAFMSRYGLDDSRFPVVIDSDLNKVGTFVPGTAQCIRSVDWFQKNHADVIVIPSQWRARDIIEEMRGLCIACDRVLIEHDGGLIDFHQSEHPY